MVGRQRIGAHVRNTYASAHDPDRRAGPRLRASRPRRQPRAPLRASRAAGRPLLLSQGRHPRLYDAGVRHPRPPRGLRGGRRDRSRRLARRGRRDPQVPRQAGPQLHPARRCRPRGRRAVRRLGREVDVRAHVHGRQPLDVRDRRRRHGRPRDPEGVAEDTRRPGAQGPARDGPRRVTPGALAPVHVAHADAWEVEGKLRERDGGGAREVRGLRLMASGLKHAQWNSGDVTAPDADVDAARAFYAQRGADWGVRVPAGMPWRHGRLLLTLDIMALEPGDFAPVEAPGHIAVRLAEPGDLETVVSIDAAAFEADPAAERPWLAPHLGGDRITTALATLDGEPAGTGYAIRTD